ncbi:MAG: DUF2304 domain-containing protein [Treponema sp.]|nr:DUF2304 domain-containing protein [Candidatus Treponema merdequi]
MSKTLQVFMISVTILFSLYVTSTIRRSKVKIDYTFFWIVLSLVMIITSIFPQIGFWGADLFGFVTPFHFVITVAFFFLFYKVFTLSLQMSKMQDSIEKLTQTIALREMKWMEENANTKSKKNLSTQNKSEKTKKKSSQTKK